MRTNNQKYDCTCSNSVPNITTIDWRETRPVYVQIYLIFKKPNVAPNVFSRQLRLRLSNTSVFALAHESCFMDVRWKTNANHSYLLTVFFSTIFVSCRSPQDWASGDVLYFTPIFVSCRSPYDSAFCDVWHNLICLSLRSRLGLDVLWCICNFILERNRVLFLRNAHHLQHCAAMWGKH